MDCKALIVIILLVLSCAEKNNPVISSSQYKDFAHGFWEAVSGDTLVTGEIGLIVYNWYAIDTKSNTDSVFVTWDDGIICTKTSALMKENIIEMVVNEIHNERLANGIHTKFTFKSDKEAFVTFKTTENLYEKQLLKIRKDPSVLCD